MGAAGPGLLRLHPRTHAALGRLRDQLRQIHLPRLSSAFLVSRFTANREQINRMMEPRHCLPGRLTPSFRRDRENGSPKQLGEGTSAAAGNPV